MRFALVAVALALLAFPPLRAAPALPVTPDAASFDRNPENQADVVVQLAPGAGALLALRQGLIPLVPARDYAVDGVRVAIRCAYLARLAGKTTLTLDTEHGGSADLVVTVVDTSPFAAAMEFSPDGGTYPSPRHVIVTSPAVGARIHYTLDGSEPTEQSPDVGTRTVLVDRSLTLKARAFVPGKKPGPVGKAVYTIGSAPAPVIAEPAPDRRPGAGAYEVYVGAAFYMEEMLDRGAWPYVADAADGLYHRFMGVDVLGDDGKKRLGSFFRGGKAILEGGLRLEEHVQQDIPWIRDVRAMGLQPVATFVNGLNVAPAQQPAGLAQWWDRRVALNRAEGIESFTMQAPHRIYREGGWSDPRYATAKRYTLASAGTSADAPTYLFTRREEGYRQAVYDLIRWTHAQHRRFLFIVSPNEGEETFLADTMLTVRQLEDHDCEPDFYGVTLYGKRSLHLVPESEVGEEGKRRGASTLTGAAYYLLKHARADGGELDLWAETSAGRRAGQGESGPSRLALAGLAADAAQGGIALTLHLANRSSWVDFTPVLRASTAGLPPEWRPQFLLGDTDITAQVIGGGHKLYQERRLMPAGEQQVSLVLRGAPGAHLPPAARIVLEIIPHPGSRFVRDTLTLCGE